MKKRLRILGMYAVICLLMQFYFIQPYDTIWTVLGNGLILTIICFSLYMMVDQWTHRP